MSCIGMRQFFAIAVFTVCLTVCQAAAKQTTTVAAGKQRTPLQASSIVSDAANSTYATIYEAHAMDAIAEASKRMQHIYHRKREIFHSFTQSRGYNVVNQDAIKQEIDNDYHNLVYELAAKLSVIPVRKLKNPTLRRQVQRLSKLQLYGLRKGNYNEAKELLQKMQSFLTSRLVCLDDCTQLMAMVPTVAAHIIRARQLKEVEYYWLKWRQVLGEEDVAKSTFIDFVRLLRKAASYNGHVTPSRTWYLYYDSENFQRELEDVMWEIMPLYQELHTYLRHSVRLIYGEQVTQDDGAIPAPVLQQMLLQAWYPRPVFRTPYPKSQLPTVKQKLEEVLVTPVKINKKAAEFFESLGLKHMSESFYEKFSRRISDDEVGPDCKSEVFYFPPDVALRYCPKLDYKILLQMHSYMAELQYNLYKLELPFGLDREPCPGFGSALGETTVIASGTPRHLHRLHILANDSLNAEQSMNRLFRMGIHTLLAIPQYFINEKYLVDVMDGRISSHEYNCGYWRLQYKYAGVVPPFKRSERNFDPDFKFYRGLNPEKSNTAKLITEILGYQFYRAFCLASGEYKPGNPDYPLHNCDFYDSKKAGEMMKKMMQLGATKHWRYVMEIATGETKLSAKGIMEYFGPLLLWLKEKNKRLDLQTGWDDDINCGNN